jgi:hypothetical protein
LLSLMSEADIVSDEVVDMVVNSAGILPATNELSI